MLRFLIVIIILALIANLLLKLMGYLLRKRLHQTFASPPPPKPLEENLVRCDTCHLFIPLSKAQKQNDRYYCRDHRTND